MAVDQGSAFVRVEGVEKTFVRRSGRSEHRNHVLQDIVFEARLGEFVTIIGPSGCGKSTLLNAIAGLTGIDGGAIVIDGVEIDGPGVNRAMVFQHASLLPWRSVARNVGYGLELRRELDRPQREARVQEVLRLVGLEDFASHYPHELSGGMQQRVNLARALAVDPELVLMDEPFGALDALTKEVLQDELAALAGGSSRTTLFITHDIEEAAFLADKILVMSARPGRIEAEIEVPFERPRARGVMDEPRFMSLVRDLRSRLRGGMEC